MAHISRWTPANAMTAASGGAVIDCRQSACCKSHAGCSRIGIVEINKMETIL